MHVTMDHEHVLDDPDTHIKVLQCYTFIDAYSFLLLYHCFVILNPCPCVRKHHTFHMPMYV